jgi:hypothetical protein
MPWTCQPSLRRKDTLSKRRTIMRAVCRERLGLVLEVDEQDFAVLDTFDLDFAFLAVLDVGQRRDVFELKVFGHCCCEREEACVSSCWDWESECLAERAEDAEGLHEQLGRLKGN